MALIYTHNPKRKARKPDAKQRELASEWQALLKKYETKPVKQVAKQSYSSPKTIRRETPHIPSLDTGVTGPCSTKAIPQYTGTAMLGISTLHKSNAVPVFSQEDAKEHSRMRRG
jgi:cytoplasmic iron level regulating protein YaaA (DUF328/UPF0246 family)